MRRTELTPFIWIIQSLAKAYLAADAAATGRRTEDGESC